MSGPSKIDTAEFSTGAKRGTEHADCDLSLIPPEALRAYGRAFAEGAAKYGKHNWLKGFPQTNLLNHAIQHIYNYLSGDKSEDHLGHAMWNIGAAIHQQKFRPDMIDLPPYNEKRTDNVVDAEFTVIDEQLEESIDRATHLPRNSLQPFESGSTPPAIRARQSSCGEVNVSRTPDIQPYQPLAPDC